LHIILNNAVDLCNILTHIARVTGAYIQPMQIDHFGHCTSLFGAFAHLVGKD
jgi:hypothetical protein